MALWKDTLLKLREGDLPALSRRLDWVLKLSILERVRRERPALGWHGPEMKHLDLMYSSLDEAEGLYWAYERSGFTERVVSEEEIERLRHEPPEDTRAWTRAMLLRRAGPDVVEDVNWDSLKFRSRGRNDRPSYRALDLSNPLGFTRADIEPLLEKAESLEEILDALGAGTEVESSPHRAVLLSPWTRTRDGEHHNGEGRRS